MFERVMGEKAIRLLKESGEGLESYVHRAYNAATECAGIIEALKEVKAINVTFVTIERDFAFRKARKIVQSSLHQAFKCCRRHLKISDIPLSKVVKVREYTHLARIACEQCRTFREENDGNIECPVILMLSRIG